MNGTLAWTIGRVTLCCALGGLVAGCGAAGDEAVARSVEAIVDGSGPTGTWRLIGNGARLTLTITTAGNGFAGTLGTEGSAADSLSQITWDATGRWLEFRRDKRGAYEWHRVRLVEGVMAGRFSRRSSSSRPAKALYTYHVTGWNEGYVDQAGLYPRVWNLTVNTAYRARLRIDRDRLGVVRGRMKVYSTTSGGSGGEELEFDLQNVSWNGTQVAFTRVSSTYTQVYTGTASGRLLSGTFTSNGSAPRGWSGSRAEVLTYGLGSRFASRTTWQERTRAQLEVLTQGLGAPLPNATATVLAAGLAPFLGAPHRDRDDNPNAWPQSYGLTQLRFTWQPPSLFDPAAPAPARTFKGYLAVPTAPPPAGGYRTVLAFNGHGGSARAVMTPGDVYFWYGDSFARRGYLVLAIDISHRDYADDSYNQIHPAVLSTGYTSSDWEQDGERTADATRALSYLLTRPDVNPGRVLVSGLSMGGEITHMAALDPRVALSVPAGYTADMNVMRYNGNHSCFEWSWGDVTEYVDVSDFESLIAPRPQVLLTGRIDTTFSIIAPPFSGAKQILRRTMFAYDDGATGLAALTHYFHYDTHRFHAGDINPSLPNAERGVVVPTVQLPAVDGDLTWQTSAAVQQASPTIFDLLTTQLP